MHTDQAMVMELWRQDRLARASSSAVISWALGFGSASEDGIFETGNVCNVSVSLVFGRMSGFWHVIAKPVGEVE